MYQLHITPSIGKPWSYSIDNPLTRIGRAQHCNVVIGDPLVSREHCRIHLKTEGPILEDLGSANGTFVNDQRVTTILIKPGDKIRLGVSEVLFLSSPEKESTRSKTVGKKKEADPISFALVSEKESPPTILLAHPDQACVEGIIKPLKASGARILTAASPAEIQSRLDREHPDCVLLCPRFEKASDLCQEIRSRSQAGLIILLPEEKNWTETFSLLKSGADDVLLNPDQKELLIRVKSMLEIHRLRKEAGQLSGQVEQRVSRELSEVERTSRLKRYLSPQIVEAVLTGDESEVLKPVRRELTIVFSDLRNYTRFSEVSEPEEIITMLSDFHTQFGEIIFQYDGTLERFAGDGVMVFFGAPVPFEDHARRAVSMAVKARERLKGLKVKWQKLGYSLDIAFGISTGYVFVGNIGFEGRRDYAAIGKTTNLAARLCSAAKGGQILISRKTLYNVEDLVEVEEIGALEVKGFSDPVLAYNVLGLKSPERPAD